MERSGQLHAPDTLSPGIQWVLVTECTLQFTKHLRVARSIKSFPSGQNCHYEPLYIPCYLRTQFIIVLVKAIVLASFFGDVTWCYSMLCCCILGLKWWNKLSSPVTMLGGISLLSGACLSRSYKNTSWPLLCLPIGKCILSTNFPLSQN